MRPVLPYLLAGALIGLGACSATDYYLLPPPNGVARPASSTSISVADISLPSYADSIEIAELTDTGAVTLSKNALWADTPRRALTRHLVAALQSRLGGQIGTEPWPAFEGPGLRVEVIADRMIGAPDAPLQFDGQYIIVAPESGRIIASNRFSITVPPRGPGYTGLMADHARAIEILADDIAARISGVRRLSA